MKIKIASLCSELKNSNSEQVQGSSLRNLLIKNLSFNKLNFSGQSSRADWKPVICEFTSRNS